MGLRFAPAILLGRLARFVARLRKPGGGSAVPGLVVNRVAPGFLPETLSGFRDGLVVVSGSSGKSTTTKMLVTILEAHGRRVFTNPSTANIAQGLTSALLERVSLSGRIDADLAVLEMDEGHGAAIAPRLRPRVVVLTNVMTDQIDRFFDSERVQGMLGRIAARASERVVLNGDDAMLAELELPGGVAVDRFGVSAEVRDASPRGLGLARETAERLASGVVVESSTGRSAVVSLDGSRVELALPAKGLHYALDAAAALASARGILGADFDAGTAAAAISGMTAVFARGEITTVRGQQVEFVLVQNPASYQLNVDALDEGLDQVLVAMGSDVRDPGYFWPVDPARIGRARIATGVKAHEFALHLAYHGVEVDRVELDLARAVDDFLALPAPERGVKTIIFTADSMRRIRSHLGLAS
ncbi:Mur ligase family protein [Homoserinibacter sp. YIM 151385]|uniref:Mur ligase family protein n=1 Tax=Homoserinibacter sp. YIM 151385 TaxID=2985506 RepID=UPI0022F02728|nr:Mur ligase family protein [Homoserinibacter sp. YIM 151385]WBU38491.1 Mur ligase family protein [Homoserinibacter sp. YIM 151385]